MGVISLKDYKNPNIRRELIMKHYSTPSFKNALSEADINAYSNHCVDELHISLTFNSNVLKTAKWDGIGCAIFQSSTDIMLGLIIGKTKEEINYLLINYENLINQINEKVDEEAIGKLMIYSDVKAQLNRLNCANMVSQALIKFLNNKNTRD